MGRAIPAIKPNGKWEPDDRKYYDVPMTGPLTEVEIAKRSPTLGLTAHVKINYLGPWSQDPY